MASEAGRTMQAPMARAMEARTLMANAMLTQRKKMMTHARKAQNAIRRCWRIPRASFPSNAAEAGSSRAENIRPWRERERVASMHAAAMSLP